MSTLTFVVLFHCAVVGAETDSYDQARRETTRTGRPMVVLVGADWCPACVEMKQRVVPKVKRRGLLKKVAYAFVNLDRHRKLGRELTEGGPIPQVIMFRKTPAGWRCRRLIGGQSPEAIESFIKQGIKLDEATRRAQTTQPASTKLPPSKAGGKGKGPV